jgi:hypothetical protein
MKRDQLLSFLDKAIELVPKSRLAELATGLVPPGEPAARGPRKERPLARVRSFHAAVMRGDYYESFNVNSRNFKDQSKATQRFIDQTRRLIECCVRAAETEPGADVREAFELMMALLRRIDDGDDEIVFFADEAGSWQVGVDWRTALPAYFKCLAASAEPDEFARLARGAIADFADGDRSKALTEARRVASKEQKAAIKRIAKEP